MVGRKEFSSRRTLWKKDHMGEHRSRVLHISDHLRLLLLPILLAIVVGYSHYNFIEYLFSNGAYNDIGRFSFLAFKNTALQNPQLYLTREATFYGVHIAPLFILLSLPSFVLPFD